MSTTMARMMELSTPLGKDLLFRELRGREELGRPSAFELSALSTRADIKPSDLLGKSITVKLELVKGGFRYFNGYVTRFSQGTIVGKYYEYRMTVNAWLWFLTRTADCKIFQEKTPPEIIKEVFGEHSMAIFEDALTGMYAKREYCVQYRETDFAFVSRLMEEEGIYYYFEHKDGKHTLKLVDSESGHKKLENKASIAFYPPGRALHGEEEYIQAFRQAQCIQPGSVALQSFDFVKPKSDLGVKAKNIQPHNHADYEIFDYAGDYVQADHGDHYVQLRVDELHSEFERAEAECNVRDIAVGRLFELTNAPRKEQEKEYLIVSADWDMRNNTYEASINEDAAYSCTMTVLQSKQQFRPARTTGRPTMGGPQTAVVVGPTGEEIYCDKHGRVKVQFHWDRYGKKDENSSCWVRVSQPWAGKDWGTVSIPRIGQEVVVDFLEGDPDQPLITGRVYNGDNPPPYPLPAGAVVSGIKTRTHKGAGYNEISADDTAGKQKITIHGQYDMNTTVQHNMTTTVKNNRTITVDGTHTEHIKGDTAITVTKGTFLLDVAANKATVHVNGNLEEALDSQRLTSAKDAIKMGAGQGIVLVGNAKGVAIQGNGEGVYVEGNAKGVALKGQPDVFLQGTAEVTLKAPKVTIGDTEINLLGTKITLQAGSGKIVIDGTGVTITGAIVKIN
jgi:type VI secretion system secreted protein VgrG